MPLLLGREGRGGREGGREGEDEKLMMMKKVEHNTNVPLRHDDAAALRWGGEERRGEGTQGEAKLAAAPPTRSPLFLLLGLSPRRVHTPPEVRRRAHGQKEGLWLGW